MSFTPKSGKLYSISLKSPTGNTVGFINLTPAFLRAVTGKQAEHCTVADVHSINNGKLMEYLNKMTLEISAPNSIQKLDSIEDF